MIEIFGIIATALAILGVVLNNRRLIVCFYLWLISNALTGWIHYDAGIYSLLIRDIVFFVLAVEGIYRWRKKTSKNVKKGLDKYKGIGDNGKYGITKVESVNQSKELGQGKSIPKDDCAFFCERH